MFPSPQWLSRACAVRLHARSMYDMERNMFLVWNPPCQRKRGKLKRRFWWIGNWDSTAPSPLPGALQARVSSVQTRSGGKNQAIYHVEVIHRLMVGKQMFAFPSEGPYNHVGLRLWQGATLFSQFEAKEMGVVQHRLMLVIHNEFTQWFGLRWEFIGSSAIENKGRQIYRSQYHYERAVQQTGKIFLSWTKTHCAAGESIWFCENIAQTAQSIAWFHYIQTVCLYRKS